MESNVLFQIFGLFIAILLILSTSKKKSGNLILGAAIGASGGLPYFQIFHIHYFTIFCFLFILKKHNRENGQTVKTLYLFFSCVLMALTSLWGDLVNNRLLSIQLLLLSLSAIIVVTKSDKYDIRNIIYGFVVIQTTSSVFAFGQVFGLIPGLYYDSAFSGGRPTGLHLEPDWLGIYSSCALIILLTNNFVFRNRSLVIILNALALIYSGCRGAWVSLVIVLIIFLFIKFVKGVNDTSRRKTKNKFKKILPLLFFIVLLEENIRLLISERVNGLLSKSLDISASARILQNETMLNLLKEGQIYGHGLSASGNIGVLGGLAANGTNSVGSNWALTLLVDCGIFAIPFFLLLIYLVFKNKTLTGLLVFLNIMSNALISNVFYQPIFWLSLALLMKWEQSKETSTVKTRKN
jgi:hypothetical protein